MSAWQGFVAALALALLAPVSAFAQSTPAQPQRTAQALREQDLRLAALAERMQFANRDLCSQTMPLTGMLLHSADQYGSANADAAASAEISVMDVLPGSPAALAGIVPGDAIVSVAGVPVAHLRDEGEQPFRDDVFWAMAGNDGSLEVTLQREGSSYAVELAAPRGCRALVEIVANDEIGARSDGRVIQVNFGLAAQLSDEQLAVVFAHELAHAVLRHRARLEAAGVRKGFFAEFGRNRRLSRQAEIEADRMSVHLLHNAGYDPALATAFWLSEMGEIAGGGAFRSRIYPSPEQRSEIVRQEVASYLAPATGLSVPSHLLGLRDGTFPD